MKRYRVKKFLNGLGQTRWKIQRLNKWYFYEDYWEKSYHEGLSPIYVVHSFIRECEAQLACDQLNDRDV